MTIKGIKQKIELAKYNNPGDTSRPQQRRRLWDLLPKNQAIKDANEFNADMAVWAYNKELEQWHRENAYNDPSAMMQRMKDAGLNPAMMYGGGGTVEAAASSPSYDNPKIDPAGRGSNPLALAQMLQALEAGAAKIENIRADTEATRTGEKYTGSKLEGQESINRINAMKAELIEDFGKQDILAKIGLTNTSKDLNILKQDLTKAQTLFKENATNLMKMGLNNSDNVILRLIGTYGAKNPVEAGQLLNTMSIILNQLF